MRRSCFFIGHRDVFEQIEQKLSAVILNLISENAAIDFYMGRYGRFDSMAARVVKNVKRQYADIRLILVVPYHPAGSDLDKPEGFDEVYYPLDVKVPPRLAIIKANENMIDRCDILVAYAVRPGKARDFTHYAKKREDKGKMRIVMVPES